MKRIFFHVYLPAALVVVFFAIAATPVEVLGCAARGLMALAAAFISGLAALFTACRGSKAKKTGDPEANWWLASSLILAIPVIAMIILA